MPDIIAHNLFGKEVKKRLNKETLNFIKDYENLFQLGFLGPDLFFYYKPTKKNEISTLGLDLHKTEGQKFFSNILRKNIANNGSIAYTLGMCCHFALDRACHPTIDRLGNNSTIYHRTLESNLDRYVVDKFNLSDKRYSYIKTDLDYNAISLVYSVDESIIKKSVKSILVFERMLLLRPMIQVVETMLGQKGVFSALCLKKEVTLKKECDEIFTIFNKTVPVAVSLVQNFYDSALKNEKLVGFEKNFGGK